MKSLASLFRKNKKEKLWDKYYPKDKDNITVPNMSIYEYLEKEVKERNSIAINYFNYKISYTDLFKEIDICAKALRSQGIRPGDVVTILMPNTPEAVISFYAINKIGAIANMVHPLSAEEEIKHSLISTKSVLVITINLAYEKIQSILKQTGVYKVVIVSASDSMPKLLKLGYNLTQGRKILSPKKSEEFIYWHEFMEKGKRYYEDVLVKTTKDQDAVILHSGGTTGTPKNIVLTNGNVNAIIEQVKIMVPNITADDKMLSILPLFHCFGLVVCIHCPLCLNATAILIPQFDAKRFDKLLVKYNPTVLPGVPTLFEALVSNPHMDKVNLAKLKYVISGGDTLPPAKNEMVNKFLQEHNCNTHVIQGYGMTETTGPVTLSSLGADVSGSVGIPLPGNDLKIIDPDTKEECEIGQTGEICVSGPTVMKGYLDNIKETNEMLEKDKKGKIWIHTGDLGYINENGILFFAQRLKRMLIVSGYNVYPSHIEDVILKHPYVLNCGVIGVPHPYKVQIPKAYIVLNPDVKDCAKVRNEIKEYCEKNLARYMLPKEYVYRESLPKTMIGKVNYRELEEENKSH